MLVPCKLKCKGPDKILKFYSLMKNKSTFIFTSFNLDHKYQYVLVLTKVLTMYT